jgi:ElaB/YqjD/DUF883 family membrane-anchored ribosome-binding protein
VLETRREILRAGHEDLATESDMLASVNNTNGKKDLHVGGLGATPSATLASVIDPLMDASENWVQKARDFVASADDYVRDNPWQALGVVAMVGVTLGYLLSRRSPQPDVHETWVDD